MRGEVAPGFESVREAFGTALEQGELGASVSAYLDGRNVVNLWGGWADAAKTREWQSDTIACTYSATKGTTAACALRLVERGVLDLDQPVAAYWPEFAQAGKDGVTVRMVLSHQAGLPWTTAPYPPEKRYDWKTLVAALEKSAPVWEPGTRCEYHGGTFGYLVGELVRRVDGRPLATYFREEIAEPLGVDFLIDVGPEHDDRCAEMVGPEDDVGPAHTREWRSAGDGSATGFGTADGLARLYAALACEGELDGFELLRADTIEAAIQDQPLVTGEPGGDFGLGYQLFWKMFPNVGPKTFGFMGLGGSLTLANPTRRFSFGYVMNQMGSRNANEIMVATYRAFVP